jgi:hypothetical protein
MHYNHFTIEYLNCLQKHLKITSNNDETLFFPDFVTNQDIQDLKESLDNIWIDSQSSIDLLSEKREAKLQAGLFGLVGNFDLAVKTGYLLSDRIVIIDFIYHRILSDLNQVNKIILGEVARNLVKMKELANDGRFVIIPSPFFWNEETKNFIKETGNACALTPNIISLLNILSICKKCNLQPYTIAENELDFNILMNEEIDLTSLASKTTSISSYNSILAGLMSEKLLNVQELNYVRNIPISRYASEIREGNNFYNEYLRLITHNGVTNFDNNFEELHEKIITSVKNENTSRTKKIFDNISKVSTVGIAGVAIAETVVAISAPILLASATLALGSTIAGMFTSSNDKEDIIISVFRKLNSI